MNRPFDRGRRAPRDPPSLAVRIGREMARWNWRRTFAPLAIPATRTGEGKGRYQTGPGFRAITTSIAFRWGTPLDVEMNSTCPESKICQSP